MLFQLLLFAKINRKKFDVPKLSLMERLFHIIYLETKDTTDLIHYPFKTMRENN